MDAEQNKEQTPTTTDVTDVTEADGYYDEDEMDAEELDLSFLDEEEAGASIKPGDGKSAAEEGDKPAK